MSNLCVEIVKILGGVHAKVRSKHDTGHKARSRIFLRALVGGNMKLKFRIVGGLYNFRHK